jgi:predicted AlkP superfamily phosphohydrolase/phosphomutase
LAAYLLGEPGPPGDPLSSLARVSFLRDAAAEEYAGVERTAHQHQVLHLRLDGLNRVQAYFYKYSFPQQYGDITQDRIDRYGPVIERYYEYYDGLIGKFLTGLKDDEILVVYSPFGVEPLPLWKRFVERLLGDPEVSAYHELAPDGVVFFYGRGVRQTKSEELVRITDIAPTLLYFLGLPVGRDMDGIVRSSVFADDFRADNPIIYISSYEEFEIQPPQ